MFIVSDNIEGVCPFPDEMQSCNVSISTSIDKTRPISTCQLPMSVVSFFKTNRVPYSLVIDQLGKLTLMVRNPCMWPAPMNKMAGTPLGKMADQTVVGSVHNSDHEAFASCGGSLKASDSSALVSPTDIIIMSSRSDIEAGNHEELLSGMTNNMREAAMDALVLLWLKNLNVDESLIIQSISIQDKFGSYIAAARGLRPKPSATRGLKLDPSILKAKFHSLFSENLCKGVYVSSPRKVMET
ncbi:hypothetical protein Tco_0341694, partial [Tanacetum coccineum]